MNLLHCLNFRLLGKVGISKSRDVVIKEDIKIYIYENWYHLITINLPVAASVGEEEDEEEEEDAELPVAASVEEEEDEEEEEDAERSKYSIHSQ